jgi:hypothetical protein
MDPTSEKKRTPSDKKRVEILIMSEVRDAAQVRADSQDVALATIAKTIIWKASASAQPPSEGQAVAHPARRPANSDLKRVRFMANRAQFEVARDRIRASGKSVAQALEAGLEKYARTGKF